MSSALRLDGDAAITMMLLEQWRLSMLPLIMLMMTIAASYLQWWYRSNDCRRGSSYRVGALDFYNVALLDYVIVNQIMMLLLWRLHYSMAPIVVMMSVAAIN